MKQIQISDQVRLGPGRCLSLTVSGILYRLFRSMITVAILTLAVTFLSHILSYSLIEHETRLSSYRHLSDSRQLGQWVTHFTSAESLETIEQSLLADDPATIARYQRRTSAQLIEGLREPLDRIRRFHDYLDRLPIATRVVLAGSQSAWSLLRELNQPAQLAQFQANIKDLHLPQPDFGAGGLNQLVAEDMPRIDTASQQIRAAQQAALDQLHQAMGSRTVVQWLAANADSPQIKAQLQTAGFELTDEQLASLITSAIRQDRLEQLSVAIQNPAVARAITRQTDIPPAKQTLASVSAWMSDQQRADWLMDQLREAKAAGDLNGAQLLELARSVRMERRWTAAVGDTQPQPRNGLFDLPRRTQWLIVLSFLVCAAGVTNAMFMSVTERFAEIATMKCLGAMDGFLMQMFLMESALQGAVGGLFGITLGIGLAILRGMGSFGSLTLAAMPWSDLAMCAVLSLLAGMVLAVASAVGPAWMAARLAPMEAMRID